MRHGEVSLSPPSIQYPGREEMWTEDHSAFLLPSPKSCSHYLVSIRSWKVSSPFLFSAARKKGFRRLESTVTELRASGASFLGSNPDAADV
jgi:hypothetical protein